MKFHPGRGCRTPAESRIIGCCQKGPCVERIVMNSTAENHTVCPSFRQKISNKILQALDNRAGESYRDFKLGRFFHTGSHWQR